MNEISKQPLVDILSNQLNKTIVMRDMDYVELGTEYTVPQDEIDTAIIEQDAMYQVEYAKVVNSAIQSHLDTQAQSLRYDSMMSARSYAGYINPFQAEATKLAVWASDCWVQSGVIETDVKSGVRAMPTVDEVLAELPVYV